MIKDIEEVSIERLKVDTEPVRIQIISEPYIVHGRFGYQAAFDVWLVKRKRECLLLVAARSLSAGIEKIVHENECTSYVGLEFWIQKENETRMAKYIVSE